MNISEMRKPLHIIWNVDENGDKQSVLMPAETYKVINGKIALPEIPDEFYSVKITYDEAELIEIDNRDFQTKITADKFRVKYNMGLIFLDSSLEGKDVTVEYYSRGMIMYPASRIYTDINAGTNEIETLQDVVNDARTQLEGIGDIQTAVTEGSQVKIDLDNSIATANTTKTSLDGSIANGAQQENDLDSSTSTAQAAETSLVGKTTIAQNTHDTLTSTITQAENKDSQLKQSIEDADAKKTELDNHTNVKKSELDSHTSDKETQLDAHTGTKETQLDDHTVIKKSELDSYVGSDVSPGAGTKKKELDDYTAIKEGELNTYRLAKEGELDTHTGIKEGELDAHTSIKKSELDSYESAKEGEIDTYTTSKKGELDTHTSTKESQLDTYTTARQGDLDNHTDLRKGDLDSHTTDKKTELDNHTSSKEAQLDSHTTLKESQLNAYESGKESELDTFTVTKKGEITSHAETKKGELDTHVGTWDTDLQANTGLKGDLDTHTTTKKSEIDSHTTAKESQLDVYTAAREGDLDTHTTLKKSELDSHEGVKEGQLDTYTDSKKSELDTYTDDKKTELNTYKNLKQSELQNTIDSADTINTTLNGSVQAGQNKIQEMDSKISEADTKITETETARQSTIDVSNRVSVFEEYDNLKTYYSMNKVYYQGSSYVCIAEANGKAPTDTSYWQIIALAGTGTVMRVSSSNGDISIADPTTNPTLTLNTGTGANQITKLDSSGKLSDSVINKGLPNTVASLDDNGTIPLTQIPASVKEIKVVNTITDRDVLTPHEGLRVHVKDASADATVESGWAEYLWDGSQWTKTSETESIDIVLDWGNIQNKDVIGDIGYTPLDKSGDTIKGELKFELTDNNRMIELAKLYSATEQNDPYIEFKKQATNGGGVDSYGYLQIGEDGGKINVSGGDLKFEVDNGYEVEVNSNKVWHEGNFNPSSKASSVHTHTKDQITDLSLDWSSISGKPTTFTPSTHQHSKDDITNLTLDWGSVTGKPTTFTPSSHNHDGVYEPVVTKKTAFNKDFGGNGTAATVARSDHNHDTVYEPKFTKKTAFNKDFGTTAGSIAEGNHTHPQYLTSYTNNYITGLSGNGDSILTVTRQGLQDITVDLSHSHSEYASSGHNHDIYLLKSGGTITGDLTVNGDWNWAPDTNFSLSGTSNDQGWSFDLKNCNTYSGSRWSVWSDKSNQHILTVRGDTENVGVCNSNPTEKLDVDGTVKATAFKAGNFQMEYNSTTDSLEISYVA